MTITVLFSAVMVQLIPSYAGVFSPSFANTNTAVYNWSGSFLGGNPLNSAPTLSSPIGGGSFYIRNLGIVDSASNVLFGLGNNGSFISYSNFFQQDFSDGNFYPVPETNQVQQMIANAKSNQTLVSMSFSGVTLTVTNGTPVNSVTPAHWYPVTNAVDGKVDYLPAYR